MTKKTKIFLNGRFLTSPQTGVQRTAYELVLALDTLIDRGEIDISATSFVLIYSGTIVNPIQLKHIVLLKRGFLSGNLWEQLELPLYTFGSFLVNMGSIAPLFKRKQLVVIHDVSFLVNKSFFSKKFRLWYANAIPLLGKLSRCIVTVSNFSKQELINRAGINANKITVIYNSAKHLLRFGEPNEAFKDKVMQLKPFCLAVSSLGANKNFGGLSNALKGVALGGHKMVIAGGKLGALKNASPNQDAIYLGFVTDEELVYLYQHASLFIFPSFYEGFGIPPLEAMLMGCPVIASNTSSMPEVLGDAAAYLDPYQPAVMGQQISALINDPQKLSLLVQRGYERAERYSWHDSAHQLYHLIQKCNG
jgi:glycosyltransferase involved in cell wall biosynthesis